MTLDINKVILVGTVGINPDIRMFGEGRSFAKFSIATSKRFKKNGEYQQKTVWHNIACFDRLSDFVVKWISKGDRVYVEGEIAVEVYNDGFGKKKSYQYILASQVKIAKKKGNGQPSTEEETQEEQQEEAKEKTQPELPVPGGSFMKNTDIAEQEREITTPEEPVDDDIPF